MNNVIHSVPENYNKGVKYLEKANYTKALTFFKREQNTFKELYLNMGSCWSYLDDDVKALHYYNLAASHDIRFADGTVGEYPEALNNIGIIKYCREQDLEAISYYNRALASNPEYHTARWHRSLSELRRWCSGHVDINPDRALIDYDFRFYVDRKRTEIDVSIPRWDGVSGGRSIVVLAEQGIGDTIQWTRYAKLLGSYFDKVWVQMPTSAHCLFPDHNVISHLHECDAEVSVPLCSLTRYFDVNAAPHDYISRVEGHNFDFTGLKVGVVAEGSKTHNNNFRRSCGIHQFLKLVMPGVQLYNLTPGARPVKNIVSLNPATWLETRSYLCGLDLVISVDTSVVHLAGTLGVPCWMLSPSMDTDWRWGDSSCGEHNVWYPSVRVIRNPNNWDAVFRVVKDRLHDLSSKQT